MHADDGELRGALRVFRDVHVAVADYVVVDTEDVGRQGEERVGRQVVDAGSLHRYITRSLDVDSCEHYYGCSYSCGPGGLLVY